MDSPATINVSKDRKAGCKPWELENPPTVPDQKDTSNKTFDAEYGFAGKKNMLKSIYLTAKQ